MTTVEQCQLCLAGTSCPVGSAEASECLPGSYGATDGQETCELCAAGKYTGTPGNTACLDCDPGKLCVEGSSAPQPCPGGRHANQTVLNITGFLSDLDAECIICPEGTSCPVGSAEPTDCLPGSYGPTEKLEKCEVCIAGKYQDEYRQTQCKD